jgi:hypothetical protein
MIRNVLPRLIEIEKDNLWFYSSYTNNKMGDSRDMNGIRVGNHGIGHDKLFLMGYYLIPMGYQWDINGNGISTVRKPLI